MSKPGPWDDDPQDDDKADRNDVATVVGFIVAMVIAIAFFAIAMFIHLPPTP